MGGGDKRLKTNMVEKMEAGESKLISKLTEANTWPSDPCNYCVWLQGGGSVPPGFRLAIALKAWSLFSHD